jgi:hypothetical protein
MKEFTDETWLIGSDQVIAKGISVKVVDGEEEKESIAEPEARKRVAAAIQVIKDLAEKDNRQLAYKSKIAALAQNTLAKAVVDNFQTEAIMDFKEFIAQNPGAENDVLAYAKTKINAGTKEAVKAESSRISEIFTLAGVSISDDVKAAVDSGISPELYAKNALTKQREAEAKMKTDNSIQPGIVAQTPGEQAGANQEKPVDAITEEDYGRYAKNRR